MSEYDNLENILPVGPLKIAALEGCREFGKTVRRIPDDSPVKDDSASKHPSLAKLPGYVEDSYLFELQAARALVPVREKDRSMIPFVARICIFSWMCAITA